MHIDNVIFLILSKIAYTKFSEGPSMNFPILLPPLIFYNNCTQRRFNSQMYRYKQKNTEKNLLQFFPVSIFWDLPLLIPDNPMH